MDIVRGYVTGMIGDIVRLNAIYYQKHWGLGLDFEVRMSRDLAGFMERYDDSRDSIWTITQNNQIVAAVLLDSINLETEGTHLRYFIVDEKLQGKGLGRKLMQTAFDFCIEKKYKRVYLSTVDNFKAACHLYEQMGFTMFKEADDPLGKGLFYERLFQTE